MGNFINKPGSSIEFFDAALPIQSTGLRCTAYQDNRPVGKQRHPSRLVGLAPRGVSLTASTIGYLRPIEGRGHENPQRIYHNCLEIQIMQ
ncbi:MAG TPA: hypothetical protein VG122_18315 [Gemmata sp.]|jgi:hypothetical protein|nr:hypothetical protein [Gemmata sp.]